MQLLVIKYDGASISSAGDIRSVSAYLTEMSKTNRTVVVCSAIDRVTDSLMDIADYIRRGKKDTAKRLAASIINRHRRLARQTTKQPTTQKRLLGAIESDSAELLALIDGMILLGEMTPGMKDYILSFGERLSTKLLAGALTDAGRRAVALTGSEAGIITDSEFGEAKPLMDTTRLRVAEKVGAIFLDGAIPVVGGFVGSDQHGRLTTLGRGGSDYTATIIGSCMRADEIWLMGSVDGLFTADPKVTRDAKTLVHVSYVEAIEMALFGAKQIHPRTFEPVLSKEITMRIRSAKNTDNKGTLVTASPPLAIRNTVKCVSRIQNSGLIDIRGGSMVGMPGTAAKIFATLAAAGINVMMISQNPSESSITIVVKDADLDRAVNALEMKLLGQIIKKIDVTINMTIIALIGLGMRGTAGVASKVFTAMGAAGINVAMITQGSSELNLAFVVRNIDADTAIRALHDAFDLGRIN